MHPTLFKFGDLLVPTQIVFFVGGLLLSVFMLLRHASKYEIHWRVVVDGVVASCIGGLIFGRLFVILANVAWFNEHSEQLLAIAVGGFNVYGVLMGIAAGIGCIAFWYDHNYLRLVDLFAMVAPIMLIAVYVGNVMQGAGFGGFTDGSFGMIATSAEASMPIGYSRHPLPLYLSTALFVLYGIVLSYERYKIMHGHILAVFLIVFPCIREIAGAFQADRFIEPLFGTKPGPMAITVDTIFAIVFIAVGVGLLLFLRTRRF